MVKSSGLVIVLTQIFAIKTGFEGAGPFTRFPKADEPRGYLERTTWGPRLMPGVSGVRRAWRRSAGMMVRL